MSVKKERQSIVPHPFLVSQGCGDTYQIIVEKTAATNHCLLFPVSYHSSQVFCSTNTVLDASMSRTYKCCWGKNKDDMLLLAIITWVYIVLLYCCCCSCREKQEVAVVCCQYSGTVMRTDDICSVKYMPL